MPVRLYILWGPPGGGKSWTRTHTPHLARLPFLDLKDTRERLKNTTGYNQTAMLNSLFSELTELLDTFPGGVVLEGFFLPGYASRAALQAYIVELELESSWIQCGGHTPECVPRLLNDWRLWLPRGTPPINIDEKGHKLT